MTDSSKKVLLVIADRGFQSREYGMAKEVLQKVGIEVVTAANTLEPAVPAGQGESVPVDLTLAQIKPENYDGIFLVGGGGALEYLDNESVYDLMRAAAEEKKIFGAICISPRILAKAGLLANRKATGWNGDEALAEIFSAAGAEYIKKSVVVDGNLITASGPAAAEEWGETIAQKILT